MVHTLQTLLLVVTPYMLYTAHRCSQAATIGQPANWTREDTQCRQGQDIFIQVSAIMGS